jgi:hypothetical protein
MKTSSFAVVAFILLTTVLPSFSQTNAKDTFTKDTVIYRITYKDTVIYQYDTVYIRTTVKADTLGKTASATTKKNKFFNANSWGIGPTLGAYYSFYNGFDVNIGFGIQYYMFAVPGFRNPHMRQKKAKK